MLTVKGPKFEENMKVVMHHIATGLSDAFLKVRWNVNRQAFWGSGLVKSCDSFIYSDVNSSVYVTTKKKKKF